MALPLPRLDERTFDQLVSEGQVLLPQYAPSWTNYNASDPGITLLELFAWLAEMGFYRLDRTPAASYRSFLRLVGVEPKPAQVAETVVTASPAGAVPAGPLPPGVRVVSADGRVGFQTTQQTSVSASPLAAVLTGQVDDLVDRSAQNFAGNSPFPAFGATPRIDDALYLGFDGPLASTPAPLSLYVFTGSEEQDRRTRALLQAEWESTLSEAVKESGSDGMHQPADGRPHYGVRTAWEYFAGAGTWLPMAEVEDETRALTLGGLVRFRLPPTPLHASGGVVTPGQAGRFFIRCRLVSGRYDCAPEIRSVTFNAVPVRHAVDLGSPRVLGVGTGRAGQAFSLGLAPVVPGTTSLAVMVSGVAGEPWRETPNWDRIGPHDRAYVVAHDRGEIAFGNGRIGRVPPAGAELWATYQVGGGSSGNIASHTLTSFVGSAYAGLAVDQPFDATGGDDEEELDAAIGRALAAQSEPSRAVALPDFEGLAEAVPGVPVARAHAIPDYDPSMPCLPALGSVTVVVVPRCPAPRPEPTAELLCAVARYLERRRTLTTEVHVVGPCYTTVAVEARLHLRSGADARTVTAAARAALDRFLDPLVGGPDGEGWPVGRDVYRAELMALLNDLPGVSYVDELGLKVGNQPSARCGNAPVCRHGLVVPGAHQITIDSGSYCQ